MSNRLRSLLLTGSVAGFLCLGLGTNHAAANIVPTLEDISSEASAFRWTYQATLHPDARVEDGDFFTIYDFAGFVPGSNQQPAGWEFFSNNLGATPSNVLVNDNPEMVNLTWVRTGGTTDDVDLGMFSAVTNVSGIVLDQFASRTTKTSNNPIEDGTVLQNVGFVAVPIPLPAAALMFPLGALAAGYCYRRMRA